MNTTGDKLFPWRKNREFKSHVHGKRQKSDSSWEFLKIENEQMKTVQNNSYAGQKLREATNLCEEIMNSKRQVKGKLGHVVQTRVCRLT